MTNPFNLSQTTLGGTAGYSAYEELSEQKEYDEETLKENPGTPLPPPVDNPPETFTDFVKTVKIPDYDGIQIKKFTDLKTTCEAMDDIFEREYIDVINAKKQEIVTIIGNVFTVDPPGINESPTQDLTSKLTTSPNNRLATSTSGISNDVVNPAGITTFVYGTETLPGPVIQDVIGVKGTVYPDILAAYHYPNLSDDNHGASDLPLANGEFTRVSRNSTKSAYYSNNTLGIGETVYHSGDVDYAGAESVVTSQSAIGTYYFFQDESESNLNAILAGAGTSITNITSEIDTIRTQLRVRIGAPQGVSEDINNLRASKHREELNTWYIEAGNRTTNVIDYDSGLDALTGLATSISIYDP